MNRIDELLQLTVDRGASDLHLSCGYPPCIRVDGEIIFLNDRPALSADDTQTMLREIMPDKNRAEFSDTMDTDFGYTLSGAGRFRVNAFHDTRGPGAVFRNVPEAPPSLEDLNLGFSQVLRQLCMHTKGLIIVTGPTGSGKSTTLAAMIDLINHTRKEHIITIEDPVEFVHQSKNCLINQREVHRHTRSFAAALRAALREDPDIVLLGEMRDLETTEIALETAETGHLVFATLHTNTATSTVDRIIDKFPGERQNQIRTLLSNTLTAVIAQTLCRRQGGGRAAAAEILLATPAVRSNIRDQKTHQLPTAIQTGHRIGMRSFTDSLFGLVQDGIVAPREAYLKAVDKTSLEQKFSNAGIVLDKKAAEQVEAESGASPADLTPEDMIRKAWQLATSTNTQTRDGERALELAKKAVNQGRTDAEAMMTLAAAQAQTEDFKEAIKTLKTAMSAAAREKKSDLQRDMDVQMKFYKKSKPHPGALNSNSNYGRGAR